MSKNNITFQSDSSYQYYLNSGNADIYLNSTMKSSVAFFFRNALPTTKKDVQKRISVVNAKFPVSWYLINSTNNKIIVSGTPYLFPVGDYNIVNFMSTWRTIVGTTWTLTYSNTTKKITFANTSPFIFTDDINSIFNIIGLKSGTTYSSVSNALTSPYIVNFAGILKINIKTSTFNLNNTDAYNKGKTRTICSVPVNADQNNIVFYNNFTQYNAIFKNLYLADINIEIQDEFKNYIDFNNVDWSITLQIDILSETTENIDNMEDIYDIVKEKL